jgi:endonuclease
MDKIKKTINNALKKNETIVLCCNCQINYSGRAESFLDFGDRVIIIKSDNALLVHQHQGNAPVNYMKPNTNHSLEIQDESIILKSKNQTLKEYMDIIIKKIHFLNTQKMEDSNSIRIAGTEKDMSDMIYNNPQLIEEGFKAASREEQTKYGFIDVLGVDKNNILTVIECKRYCADLGAVTQLRRYVEKIKKNKGIERARGIIAAPKITPNALKMLNDWGFGFKQIEPPKHLEQYKKNQKRLDLF